MLDNFISSQEENNLTHSTLEIISSSENQIEDLSEEDRTLEEIKKAEEEADLYNIKNFSI
jgi:hypothetical protein